MPWSPTEKKVIRENPDFTGATVWEQDQQASIKIIAARHDYHDQDLADAITQCVNVNGLTPMLADFDMGSFQINNLAGGVAAGDAVNKSQLDALAGSVADDVITAQSFDGTTLSSTRANGDFDTVINLQPSLRINGQIRQEAVDLGVGTGTESVDVANANRFAVTNQGAFTLEFVADTAADAQLGNDYQYEGQVIIWNGVGADTISLSVNGNVRVIGAQTTYPNTTGAQILSYFIRRSNGGVFTTFVWSS